jgi:hypothetical protein
MLRGEEVTDDWSSGVGNTNFAKDVCAVPIVLLYTSSSHILDFLPSSLPYLRRSDLQSFNELPRLLDPLIHLLRIRPLTNGRLRAGFTTSLAADDGCDCGSPFGPVGAGGFVGLVGGLAFAVS